MSSKPIPYFSTQVAADLWGQRAENSEKYLSGDFNDEISAPGANLELPLTGDIDALREIGDADDYQAALLVWRSLGALSPALARENRIWTRLCHGEGLQYARRRWLSGNRRTDLPKQVGIHCFAKTQTMCRDDNALGRLWWSAFIAYKFAPDFHEEALALILKTADVRSNFVERTWMTTRPSVSKALLRTMKADSWLTESEDNFRETMKSLNVVGAGVAFEVLSEHGVNAIVLNAVERAKNIVGAS